MNGMIISSIFVVLGTQKFQLNRLIKLLDELVGDGRLEIPVVAQIGHSNYVPKNYSYHRFSDKAEFAKHLSDADLIITHGGVNSIMTALSYNKSTIVYPRLAKYGEHVDNHQQEFAKSLEKNGYVLCYDEGDDFEKLVEKCKITTFKRYISCTGNITKIVNDYLDSTYVPTEEK